MYTYIKVHSYGFSHILTISSFPKLSISTKAGQWDYVGITSAALFIFVSITKVKVKSDCTMLASGQDKKKDTFSGGRELNTQKAQTSI